MGFNFEHLRANFGHLGVAFGSLGVDSKPLGVDFLVHGCQYFASGSRFWVSGLGVDFLTLCERMFGVWETNWDILRVNFSLEGQI